MSLKCWGQNTAGQLGVRDDGSGDDETLGTRQMKWATRSPSASQCSLKAKPGSRPLKSETPDLRIIQRPIGNVTAVAKVTRARVVLRPFATILFLPIACSNQVEPPTEAAGGALPAAGGTLPASAGMPGSVALTGTSPGGAAGASLAGAAAVASGGSAGMTGTTGGEAGGAGQPMVENAWPQVNDYGAVGPFETTRDKDIGPDASFDVFRPVVLGERGRRHPIISWANGTCTDPA